MKDKMSVIKNYDFTVFSEDTEDGTRLEKLTDFDVGIDGRTIENERRLARDSNFDFHPILKEKRGIVAQERADKEKIIEDEIQKRLEEMREAAFEKGYDEGKKQGQNDVYEQTKIEAGEKLDRLGEIIDEVLKSKIKLIREEKKQLYDLIQTLAKWVILRELSDDGDYLKRLLDNLAQEIENNSEVVVYVDQENFKNMPEFIDYAKEKLSDFKNVKVEVAQDMEGPGLVLCTEGEIISGALKDQIKSLEKIFYSNVSREGRH